MGVSRDDVAKLLEVKQDDVNLGTADTGVSDAWLKKAEARLGIKLPPSYVWFLQQYGGGEILGDEVFSIYGMEFETISGGDIVYQHIVDQRDRRMSKDEIAICRTDFGEVFFFKTSETSEEDEFPVYVHYGTKTERYAGDFLGFLHRRLAEQ